MEWVPQFFISALMSLSGIGTLQHSLIFKDAIKQDRLEKLWTKDMPGRLTDLDLSVDGKVILVSIIPDSDRRGSVRKPTVQILSSNGRLIWSQIVSSKVKDQAISADGRFVVLTTYDEKMSGFNAKGKKLWSLTSFCSPIILSKAKRILCFYDGDSNPDTAYEVYDWFGRKIQTHNIPQDSLMLYVSEDERHFIIALSGGRLLLMNSMFEVIWGKTVEGEVIDVAISSGRSPRLAVLYVHRKKGKDAIQKLSVYNHNGSRSNYLALQKRVSRVKISQNGESVFTYGNSPQGQVLSRFRTGKGSYLEKEWSLFRPLFADFTSSIDVSSDQIMLGFEHLKNYLFGFGFDGYVHWKLELKPQDGYYYFRKSRKGSIFALVTNKTYLSLYRSK